MLDTHCHLDQFSNPHDIANEACRRNLFMIAMTNLPSHFQLGQSHVKKFTKVRLALGMHPLAADKHASEKDLFNQYLNQTSYIGEIGLDFSREGNSTRQIQIETFRFIANSLRHQKKYISLHSRRAENTVLDILAEHELSPTVFHWYSGPIALIDEIVQQGHYFSINLAMLDTTNGRSIIERIPPDRVLTESDGPHVTYRKHIAMPWQISAVEEHLASIWTMDKKQASAKVWSNFKKLLENAGVQ